MSNTPISDSRPVKLPEPETAMSIVPPRTPAIAAWNVPSWLSVKILRSSAPLVFAFSTSFILTAAWYCVSARGASEAKRNDCVCACATP